MYSARWLPQIEVRSMIPLRITTVFLIAFCSVSCRAGVHAQDTAAPTFCASMALSTLKNGAVPSTWEEAARYLLDALPNEARSDLLKGEGVFASCTAAQAQRFTNSKLPEFLGLGSPRSALTEDLQQLGAWGIGDQARLVMVGAWMLATNQDFDRAATRRAIFLNREDGSDPTDPIPAECADRDSRTWMGGRSVNGYARTLRWTKCGDGSVLFYLWERGWFVPSSAEWQELCRDPVGDEVHVCK
jgi:hypothetical protein